MTTYKFYEHFIYRVPSVPLSIGQKSPKELFDYSKQSFFKEAIYIASPILYDELIKWHKNELKLNEIEKLIISLNKYFTRMQSRCTPYGLFAACGKGKWGNKNEVTIKSKVKRHSRLDMNYLCSLAQKLNTIPALVPLLRFYPNNSIYKLGGELRYAEYKYIKNSRTHQLSSVDFSDYLQNILKLAESGATIHELSCLLVDDKITLLEAMTFVEELIYNQILISELEPTVTGDEFVYQILSCLTKINEKNNNEEINSIISILQNVLIEIKNIDNLLGNEIIAYRKIHNMLKTIYTPDSENKLFQIDLFNENSKSTLNSELQFELLNTIGFLNKLSINQENSNIKKFKEKFFSRYGDAELPLVNVLDTETGIGYTGMDKRGVNKLIDDIFLSKKSQQSYSINWDKQQEFVQTKLLDALKNNKSIVFFSDEDIKTIDNRSTLLPDSLPIMFRIINEKTIFLQYCGGSSAANLLGRFAHGDKEIHSIIQEIVEHEKNLNPNVILAEIVHLPESRVGNIIIRPVFRDYEIPYLGKSAASIDKQISLEDLYVSLKNEKIILRSKRLNKEIIPRLTSAHNYSNNALPIYQFLCDLQTQYFEKTSFGFSWGNLSDTYTFLPRATYKNIILAKAKWQFEKKDFKILLTDKLEKNNEILDAWRKQWNIPQYIVLVDGDNELLINFNDNLSLKMLISIVKKRERIILEEFLFDINNLLIKDEKGNGYTNEFISILLKEKQIEKSDLKSGYENSHEAKFKTIQRDFSIGSEWLYYKLYCGVKTSDKLLYEIVKPLIDELLKHKLIDKFFFIRYSDPDLHIRLRFHLNNIENIGAVVLLVNKYINDYLKDGLLSKVNTDTYSRELERYGITSIEFSESFFHIDSISTLNMLNFITCEEGDLIRWQYAIRSIEDLLDLFNFSLKDKIELVKNLKNSFFEEHGGNKELKVQLDSKFRSLRKDVEYVLKNELYQNHVLENLLNNKKNKLRKTVNDILSLKEKDTLHVSLNSLLSSYTHMMLNRIFSARQRTCEMVVYDLLHKYYMSISAQTKLNQN